MPKLVFYIGVGGQNNVCIIMILFCGRVVFHTDILRAWHTFLHQTKPKHSCMGGYCLSRTIQDLKVSLKECINWLIYYSTCIYIIFLEALML